MFTEHVKPLIEQIEKLGESLYNIQFEQHWLEAQTDRQALGTSYFSFNDEFPFILDVFLKFRMILDCAVNYVEAAVV